MIQKKDIVLWIILSIITCGIAGIIWFVQITDDVSKVSKTDDFSGIKCLLLSIITCGIYSFYWAYKIGKLMDEAAEKNGNTPKDNAIIYLILQICKLDIVNYAIMQDELNNYAE